MTPMRELPRRKNSPTRHSSAAADPPGNGVRRSFSAGASRGMVPRTLLLEQVAGKDASGYEGFHGRVNVDDAYSDGIFCWSREQAEQLQASGLHDSPDELQYVDVVSAALQALGRSCPPTKEVRMVLRLYADPNGTAREHQDTCFISQSPPVCYVRRTVRPGGGMLFGYEDDAAAVEDLHRSFVAGTTDVPPVAAFDSIFDMGRTTAEVSQELVPDLLQAIWHRRPAVVVPFGQSGSGKTFTLEGTPSSGAGVVPRLLQALFGMLEAVVPRGGGPPWSCMVQFAQVYKDQRMDLLVDRGDIIFDRLRPWPLLVVRGRRLQLVPVGGAPDAGFVTDEAVWVVDQNGDARKECVVEYKKTLFDLTLQTLKECNQPGALLRLRVHREDPASFFEHLQGLWHPRTPQHTMLGNAVQYMRSTPRSTAGQLASLAVERALEMATDLLHFLQLRALVAKVDPSNQVTHVPVDGCTMRRVRCASEFMALWERAMRLRVQARTSNNECSSRSAVTAKVSICWPHPAYMDDTGRAGGVGGYALSSLTVDDLPGAESAGDFELSDPNHAVRVSETVEIGSDLLKLGLLLGRRTSPSGRKVTEDIRCVDDRQAVVAILLCGKLHHKDLAPTLRFAHHAGRALAVAMRQKQMATWLKGAGLDNEALTVQDFLSLVTAEATKAALDPEEQCVLKANLHAALQRAKVTDSGLLQKLRTSGALFAVLQDLMGARAGAAAAEKRRAEVRIHEEQAQAMAAADLEASRLAEQKFRSKMHRAKARELEQRFHAAAGQAEAIRSAALKQAKALARNVELLETTSSDVAALESDLLALEGSGPDELPGVSFGLEELRRLRVQNEKAQALSSLARQALEILEAVEMEPLDPSAATRNSSPGVPLTPRLPPATTRSSSPGVPHSPRRLRSLSPPRGSA